MTQRPTFDMFADADGLDDLDDFDGGDLGAPASGRAGPATQLGHAQRPMLDAQQSRRILEELAEARATTHDTVEALERQEEQIDHMQDQVAGARDEIRRAERHLRGARSLAGALVNRITKDPFKGLSRTGKSSGSQVPHGAHGPVGAAAAADSRADEALSIHASADRTAIRPADDGGIDSDPLFMDDDDLDLEVPDSKSMTAEEYRQYNERIKRRQDRDLGTMLDGLREIRDLSVKQADLAERSVRKLGELEDSMERTHEATVLARRTVQRMRK